MKYHLATFVQLVVLSCSFWHTECYVNTLRQTSKIHSLFSISSLHGPSQGTSGLNSDSKSRSLYQIPYQSEVPVIEGFGKGIKKDFNAKIPFYISDFKDGFNIKCLSSTFFLFFACLAPAVAFGGLLTASTGGLMGTMEAVSATAIGGVIYALFSAQPITIIGTTGPLIAFLSILHKTCMAHKVPFLPVYSWIGLWSSFYLFVTAFFSMSNLVEYLTKFTDDIFSMLISMIFIYEAVTSLCMQFTNPAVSGLQATVSLITALTTYGVASQLCKLRTTPYFPRKVREVVSNFAPTIGVMTGIGVAKACMGRYVLDMPTLAVPTVLSTTSGRPWLVDIFSVSNEIKLLCMLPALMAYMLLYMDQNITVRLVMSKKNQLKKGSGMHLDMLVVAAITAITSLLGMPWMVAATVRSMAHLRSLNEYETVMEAPSAADCGGNSPTLAIITSTSTATEEGEDSVHANATSSSVTGAIGPAAGGSGVANLRVTGVTEQRLTGTTIHALIGAAVVFCRPLLRQIPTAVLTGLFLYLGASSIGDTDLAERSKLFITDDRDAPKSDLLTRVGLARTKLFTSIQLTFLAGMWYIKSTKLGLFFPVLIGLLGPVRIALDKFHIFKKEELQELDEMISDTV